MKNKIYLAIIFLLLIVIITLVLNNYNILNLPKNSEIKKHKKEKKSYELSYKQLDLKKATIQDIEFYFGKATYKFDNIYLFYKESSLYNDKFQKLKIKKLQDLSTFYYTLPYLMTYHSREKGREEALRFDTDLPTIVFSQSDQVQYIGESAWFITNDKLESFVQCDLNSIKYKFGTIDAEWISEADKIRIYKFDNTYFYLTSGKTFAWVTAVQDNFDPTQVPIYTYGLQFRKVN